MNNKNFITFSLKTTSIDPSITFSDYLNTTVNTTTGIVSENRCSYTWFNVNIKNIITPDIYNRYEKFNITLNSVAMSEQGSTAFTVDSRTLYVKMSGLPFISTYSNNVNSPYAILNTIQIPTTPSVSYVNNINNGPILTFIKSNENLNINISLHAVDIDDFDPYVGASALQLMGHFAFIFNIVGVVEDEIDITKNRINIK